MNSPTYKEKIFQRFKKIFVFALLTAQLVTVTLITRYSRAIQKEDYSLNIVLFFSEIIKFFVCLFFVYLENIKKSKKELKEHYIKVIKSSYVFLPPALMYVIQNLLVVICLQNLSAPLFQVINQLKILTTAIFTVTLLGKRLTCLKWFSLFLLIIGVVLVNIQEYISIDSHSIKISGFAQDMGGHDCLVGVTTGTIITIISGFSGVYIEMFLKKRTKEFTIWDRNVQLAFFSIFLTFALKVVLEDCNHAGWFSYQCYFGKSGFSVNMILLIFLKALGGLIVALVIKIANNIVKGFAVSCAIVISTIYSCVFWEFKINFVFLIGASLVIFSLLLFRLTPNSVKIKNEENVIDIICDGDDKV